ncbi:sugar ABC transporter permease [Paenibacillus sp. TRM 82003]|nr:sugar ABC transporter permease [Paenibacillus sp. TRM 82003]
MLPKRWREPAEGYLLLLPALLLLLVFVVIPIAYSIRLSFFSWDMLRPNPTFIGADNYAKLLQNPDFYNSLYKTLLYAALTVPTAIGAAVFFAFLLDKGLKPLMHLYRSFFFTPIVASTVAVSVVWLYIYHPDYGLANKLLDTLGLEPLRWLNDSKTALLSLAIMAVWKNLGFCVVICLAGLQSIPTDLEEAAKVDGANLATIVFRIKLPLLTPTLFLLLILQTIEQFQTFTQIDVMTGGGPARSTELIVKHLWGYAFERFQMGYASAIAVVILLVTLLLTVLQMAVVGRKVHYQ